MSKEEITKVRFIPCEIIEDSPYLVPRHDQTPAETTKRYLMETKSTFKVLITNALAFIVAQAVQSWAEGIIDTIYPRTETKGWGYVLSQGIYVIITFVLALIVGFLWNLGERQALKRWKFTCPA
jgi:uncharacterized membrane protein YcjF (UPF0283 family)